MEPQNNPTNQEPVVQPMPVVDSTSPHAPTVSALPPLTPPPHQRYRLGLIVAAVVLLILVGALAVVCHVDHSGQSTVDIEAHKYEAVIIIDAGGYTPGTLTVKPDTEVFFENRDQNAEGETGSNAPSHRLLQSKTAANQAAGFNSGQILGDSGYGYVFRKTGTFSFYDADNVKQTVTIIVKN